MIDRSRGSSRPVAGRYRLLRQGEEATHDLLQRITRDGSATGMQRTNRWRRRIGQSDQHTKHPASFVANFWRGMTLLTINIRSGNAKHARCRCAKCLALTLQLVGLIHVYICIYTHPMALRVAMGCTVLIKHSRKNYRLVSIPEEAIEVIIIKDYFMPLFTSSYRAWHLNMAT